MADQPTPIEDLKVFRDLLVTERRNIVRTALELREANDRGQPTALAKGWGADIRGLQDQIEAVDRAISDEERLEPSFYAPGGASA